MNHNRVQHIVPLQNSWQGIAFLRLLDTTISVQLESIWGKTGVLRFTMLPLKFLYGIKIKVQGATNLNLKGPYVIISNLQCSMDLLGIFQILPKQCTLFIKKEVLYMLTVGAVLWLCGFIFIDHKKEAEAVEIMSATGDTMLRDHVSRGGQQYIATALLPVFMES
ncbi:PREDICTED: 1-acyl-sn-glycerol-3-phosphate acyltransferase alpha-like [Thamnophis sirtalis]|uniref:1-acylglycerol-3-phosphate O-acyltransferase n=1 Tax=Thamnophis sirtalis TaxID=35019 RepID=A0A6I9XTM4_9SAUR|nr:PREDICTED: 1-acyl-sn-glycerol-3-phosphate acyltransferase alpha-like [Thamnophis sirtalis]